MRNQITNFNYIFRLRQYPAGEPHIELSDTGFSGLAKGPLTLISNLEFINNRDSTLSSKKDFNGLALIAEANEILKRNYFDPTFVIPYMPFGRHDRRENQRTDCLPINIVRSILEGVKVVTIDPHSDVTANEFDFIPQSKFVENLILGDSKYAKFVPVIPDLGASKKSASWLGLFFEEPAQCNKVRDPRTGNLSGFEIISGPDLNGKSCLIVDDICDGGGTFLGVEALLREAGASEVHLAVTHGLFTKGLEVLDCFDSISCLSSDCLIEKGYLDNDKVNLIQPDNLLFQ